MNTTNAISARIDSRIHLDETDVPEDLKTHILHELTITNPGKERALAEKVYGAEDLPDRFPLWRRDGIRITIPRGYVHRLPPPRAHHGEGNDRESGR